MQLGKSGDLAEHRSEHFGSEARAAGPQKQRMSEAGAPRHLGQARQPVEMGELVVRHAKPAEPSPFVFSGPQRRVACPQPPHLVPNAPFGQRLRDGGGQPPWQRAGHAAQVFAARLTAAPGHRREQRLVGVREVPHAVGEQRRGDIVHRDAGVFEQRERVEGGVGVLDEARARTAVIAKRIQGRGRNRGDRVGSDQFLDVQAVPIRWILDGGAGPRQPLGLRTEGGERLPARAAEQLAILLIHDLGVGNRHFADQRAQRDLIADLARCPESRVQDPVDRGVDAVDEEAGNAGHPPDLAADGGELLEPGDVRLCCGRVGVSSEEQRHIDVDALAEQRPRRVNPFGSPRHAEHEVVAADLLPHAGRLVDRALAIVREQRRDLQGGVAVSTPARVVDVAQRVGGLLHVAEGEPLGHRVRIECAAIGRLDQVVVVPAGRDRVGDDRRIRRHTTEAVVVDQMVQLTTADQAAAQLIEPHRLAEHPECAEGIVERGQPARPAEMSVLAAETSREERANQVLGEFHADHAFAEHQDVHVVVLHALVRGIGVVAQARANARDPVRGDRGAHGAGGHDNAAVRPGFAKGLADGPRVVGTIDRRAVHAHVEDLGTHR